MEISVSKDRLSRLCKKWKVQELAVFGSILRPDFNEDSDIDLLITFDEEAPWSLFDFVEMQTDFEHTFGRAVDIVEKKALRNPFRRHSILSDHQVIYAA